MWNYKIATATLRTFQSLLRRHVIERRFRKRKNTKEHTNADSKMLLVEKFWKLWTQAKI